MAMKNTVKFVRMAILEYGDTIVHQAWIAWLATISFVTVSAALANGPDHCHH